MCHSCTALVMSVRVGFDRLKHIALPSRILAALHPGYGMYGFLRKAQREIVPSPQPSPLGGEGEVRFTANPPRFKPSRRGRVAKRLELPAM
jgi:hypothetical protein